MAEPLVIDITKGKELAHTKADVFPMDLLSADDHVGHFMVININRTKGSKFKSKPGRIENISEGPATPRVQQSASSSVRRLTGGFSRIDTAIILPLPEELATNYGINWGTEDLGAIARIFDSGKYSNLSNLVNVEDMSNIALEVLKETGAKMADVIPGLNVQAAFDIHRGKIKNPYTEMMFKGVTNRSFTFAYTFFPRNEQETRDIKEIIRKLKFHAHPEYAGLGEGNKETVIGAKVYQVFPSSFDIRFMVSPRGTGGRNAKENEFLPKVSTCSITGITVNYLGETGYAVLPNESPASIKLTLNFTELEQLHKGRFLDGDEY